MIDNEVEIDSDKAFDFVIENLWEELLDVVVEKVSLWNFFKWKIRMWWVK